MEEVSNGRPSGLSSDDGAVSVSTLRASIPDAGKVLMTHAGPSSRGFEVGLQDGEGGGVLHVLAAGLADMMQFSDKPLNCIEMDVQPAGHPTFRLTMQRAGGKSPLALKREATDLLRMAMEAIEAGESEGLYAARCAIRDWLANDVAAQTPSTDTAGRE